MQAENKRRDRAAVWFAVLTPVAVLLAGILLVGLPLVPLLCIYGDGRSRRPTGILAAAALGVLYFVLLEHNSVAPIAFLAVSTAVPYALFKRGYPLRKGIGAALLAGVAAAILCFAIVSFMTGFDPAGALGAMMAQPYAESGEGEAMRVWGDQLLTSLKWMEGDAPPAAMQELLTQVRQMDLALRAQQLKEAMATLALTYLPTVTLVTGIVTGLLSWYVPLALLNTRGAAGRRVPPLGQLYIPRFFTFALMAVTLLCFILYRMQLGVTDGVYLAVFVIMYIAMVVQGVIMTGYLLGRTRMALQWQLLIITVTVLLFHAVYVWVGLFETLFSLRLGMSRMDYLRARGVDPTSSEAQDLIRQHDEAYFQRISDQQEEEKK